MAPSDTAGRYAWLELKLDQTAAANRVNNVINNILGSGLPRSNRAGCEEAPSRWALRVDAQIVHLNTLGVTGNDGETRHWELHRVVDLFL